MRIVHLVRSIGPRSMPWNDLYRLSREEHPGTAFLPIRIGPGAVGSKFEWAQCIRQDRRFISSGWLSALPLVLQVLRRWERGGRATIVHVHNPSLAWFIPIIRVVCPGIVVVHNLHNDGSMYSTVQRIFNRLAYRFADHIIGVSEYLIETVPVSWREALLARKAFTGIPNGIDRSIIAEQMESSAPVESREYATSDGHSAVVVARFVPQKNWDFILRVVAELPELKRIVWFGQGPEERQAHELAGALGLGDRISFKGTRPRGEVLATIAASDLYLAASKWEGIGVANIEAASLGCVPFLSRIGPHEEIARAIGVDTLEISSVDNWVDAVREHLSLDSSDRVAIAQRVATRAREAFDLSRSVNRYYEVYGSLVERVAPSR